ncbi:MAG: hypothetical protein H7Y27_01760, partial [Gemmatimonadaceae bacterium]|nr:hypothetical protein [Chitinophagaceae bacterium]
GLSAGPVRDVKLFSGKLVVLKNDSLFVQSGVSWTPFFSPGSPISSISVSENKLLVTVSGQTNPSVIVVNAAGASENNLQHALLRIPLQAKLWQNTVWVADSISGLVSAAGNSFRQFQPNSPQSSLPGAMATRNKTIWYAAGRGVDRFRDEEWKSFSEKNTPPIANMPDLLSPAISADGSLYVGSNGGGMLQLKEDGSVVIFRQASPLEPSLSNQNHYRVTGLAFDTENNLWIANSGAANNLAVKKADDSWRKFFVPFTIPDNAVSQIVIDDINQKWIIAPGNGLICFNHGLTIDNPGDDRWKMFRTGKGSGNLPDNAVLSIAKDRNGFIWVGTARGIGIIQCPQEVFSPAGCEAILPVVQQDNFAGYLFRDEKVQAIAVDGADRKWIGTANGVWLISADGAKTLERFTAGNSVLLDNNINSIAIDEKTGEVFFSTAKGICSYRGAATTGGEKTEDLLVFPNPVPPGYTGTIAIRGLVKDATVKIVELNGRLVYQTRALGGQAVWNGKDYLGRTVSTGVYLVLISDDSRKEKAAARIVFISK